MKKKYVSPIARTVQMEGFDSRYNGLMAASLKVDFGDAGTGNADTEWGAKEHPGGVSGEDGGEDGLW